MTTRVALRKNTDWAGLWIEYNGEYRFVDVTIIHSPDGRHGFSVIYANKKEYMITENNIETMVTMEINAEDDLKLKVSVTFGEKVNIVCCETL